MLLACIHQKGNKRIKMDGSYSQKLTIQWTRSCPVIKEPEAISKHDFFYKRTPFLSLVILSKKGGGGKVLLCSKRCVMWNEDQSHLSISARGPLGSQPCCCPTPQREERQVTTKRAPYCHDRFLFRSKKPTPIFLLNNLTISSDNASRCWAASSVQRINNWLIGILDPSPC